jgi:hypothetical protein
MNPETIFAVLLVLLGTGALGGMVVMEVSRLGVLSARRALAAKRIESMRTEAELARTRTAQLETAIERGQAQLVTMAAECQRLASVARTVAADQIELVHELGVPDGAPAPYRCVLRTVPDFARIEPRNVVFAREIWQRKNIAYVWAETPELAHGLLQRAFPTRSGVLPGAIERMGDQMRPRETERPRPEPVAEPAQDTTPLMSDPLMAPLAAA